MRPPFGRYTVHRPHIASFCGTGNNEKFLNDPTGTRRWLAFKVENIESPRTLPFEYDGIYSQAYYLYRNGNKWLTPKQQEQMRKLFANAGYPEPTYERYKYCYDFT